MRPAVFLDRDGVLNKMILRNGRMSSPRTLDEFELLPGVVPAVEVLKQSGLLVIVITNQPDIARGLLAPEELERMHDCLRRLVPVDAIYMCPHDDQDGCQCRKPKPGLLLSASRELCIDLPNSFLVGDSWKDIEAGRAVGCTTFLISGSSNECTRLGSSFVAPNLPSSVEIILRDLDRSPSK